MKTHPIGYAIGDSNDFALAPGMILKPDAAFVSKARLPRLPKHYELAPDLAVEVISPSNSPKDILEKVEAYIHYGTRLVWVIYPEEHAVRVYTPAQSGTINLHKVDLDGALDGADLLPGFSMTVRAIFPEAESD